MADFFRLKAFDCNVNQVLKKRGLEEGGAVQQFIDTQCLQLSNDKFVPFDQHTLIESGNINTKIGSGEVMWRTPYARRLYYHPEYDFSTEKNPQAGGYWFERMKQQYKKRILAGAKKIANGG